MRALPTNGDPLAQRREQRFFFPDERLRLAQARQRDATGARETGALALDSFEATQCNRDRISKVSHPRAIACRARVGQASSSLGKAIRKLRIGRVRPIGGLEACATFPR